MGNKEKGSSGKAVLWKSGPQEHDYPAAASYLSLLASESQVAAIVHDMKECGELQQFKAKDILRAARLPLLGRDNPHVASDLEKINSGDEISPILLLRGSLNEVRPLQIADGYHRVCACYHNDENTDIPCIVVDL
jgi:hypothetical protein